MTRCLFRLRFLAEQKPFDPSTFAYVFPLLKYVLLRGPATIKESEGDSEDGNEDGELAMHVLQFHCAMCPFFFRSSQLRPKFLQFLIRRILG